MIITKTPKMTIHFEKMDRDSTAYASLCKIIYDTIKSHHTGFWISTEEDDAIKAEKDKQNEQTIKILSEFFFCKKCHYLARLSESTSADSVLSKCIECNEILTALKETIKEISEIKHA